MTSPVKRGKGRPPGSKNIKTLQKEEATRDDIATEIAFTTRPLAEKIQIPQSEDEFAQRAIEYFTVCLSMKRLPTKSELALNMGYASQDSMKNTCGLPRDKRHSAYTRSMEIIEHRYQSIAVERNSQQASFLLKSVFGYSERVDITSQGGSMAPVNLTFSPPSLVSLNTAAAIIDTETRSISAPCVDATVITEDTDDTGDDTPC